MELIETQLLKEFELLSKGAASDIDKLPQSGSNRAYYRISNKIISVVATHNTDTKENLAFIEFSKHFKKLNLPVPEIYLSDIENNFYFQQDLGNTTLFEYLYNNREGNKISQEVKNYYYKVIENLPKFQILGHNNFNYSLCYPRNKFDEQSMRWDLNYFKYYFLKLAYINFDEQKIEDDFEKFISFLSQAENNFFLYRDFQSRNIMLWNNEPYFIDYQGGRKGALQYDLASLLFDSKANLPSDFRLELLELYKTELKKYIDFDKEIFEKHFYGFVLIRIFQALGAYGYRGFYERKTLFLQSIPYAIKNIEWLIENNKIPENLAFLKTILIDITNSEKLKKIYTNQNILTISVNSFSFKKGLPQDKSGNGGGFVFDCRALPNPGRLSEYRNKTGRDIEVIKYLSKYDEVNDFFLHTTKIIDLSIKNYIERGFNNLQINFGCTGGQHRSVYFAEKTTDYIKNKYGVVTILKHREQET